MFKKRITFVTMIVAAFAFTFVTFSSLSFAAEKTITWKGQSCFPVASPLGKHTITLWKNFVEQMSGGRLKITLHDVGEIVPGSKVYDAVRDGLLDFGLNTPAYQKGRYPAGDLFYTLPGGVFQFNDLILWLYGGGGLQLEQEMYGDEVVVFPLGLTPPEELWSKKPINSLADIKGIKIRAAGLSMDLWEKLGASVVLLPAGEVVPALQRGMIDASEILDASLDYTLGLHEVCKYRFGPPLHMSNNIFQLLVKPKSFNALPDDLKAIVEKAAMAATFQGYADFWQSSMEFNTKIEEYGTITTKLPKEEQLKARKLAFEILEEKAQKDPYFKKVWESQKAFIKKYKPYAELTTFD
ncbi:MAG: hypothetical protein BA862_13875 [Desulfobulbaceae bacterium S3730MH12]|nr:MAG: hypothetical protein BA866_08480 [Desulfobulbaceae bacterium S5133MH15]OEU58420.1 MAG: hypothetical protein BA862_13875 [Desulfobulbaceae bacterium S3730MH12]OEU78943.1 MAG: hypothetical protein BA873_07235 [Desulfobulbaceae bacterium C00003063]